ncbi:MAG TPA: BON domain-containing protein [Rubrivivax sp.]|nr:BON domain-containing protein [Rubrivivax sp.]
MKRSLFLRRAPRGHVRAGLLLLATALLLSGCEVLLLGGAVVGTGLVATDRRTTGTQLEDETIALKAQSRARTQAPLGRIDVTSYNRVALITGEVPAEADKAAVEKVVAGVENVRGVVNELAVGENASLAQRSADSVITGKVKASFVDAKDLQANAFRVVTERGIVYLMGRVTEREANRAAEVARGVAGVKRVVKVFDILSEEELARLGQAPAAPPAGTASAAR